MMTATFLLYALLAVIAPAANPVVASAATSVIAPAANPVVASADTSVIAPADNPVVTPADTSVIDSAANPVIDRNCPDPTVIDDRARSGWFYAYSTQSTSCGCAVNKDSSPVSASAKVVNLPVYRSRDLVEWEFVGDGFPDGRPDWVPGSKLWAPDISYVGGQYVLHYALGIWAGVFKEGCGVAVADSPEGPFRDLGCTVSWKKNRTLNSIDPDLFIDDDGRAWLYWGSLGGGIHAIEMTPDGLGVKPGARKSRRLSARNSEAAYLHKRDGKYYLFASVGTCCEGASSTYHVVVGRSDSPLGPFRGPDGQPLIRLKYKYTALSAVTSPPSAEQPAGGSEKGAVSNGTPAEQPAGGSEKGAICNGTPAGEEALFAGPGHNSGIVTDDAGQDWILFHSYDSRNGYDGRLLFLGKVTWSSDGWPTISSGTPSATFTRPVFRQ